jgi:hypothetical protein
MIQLKSNTPPHTVRRGVRISGEAFMKRVKVTVESEYPYRFDQEINLYDRDGFWIGTTVGAAEEVD